MHTATQGETWRRRWGRWFRIARILLTLLIYFSMSPFGYLFFAALSALPTRHPVRRARRLLRVQQVAFRVMMDWLWLMRIWRFDHREVPGREHLPPGPCVVVGNHPSLIDGFAMIAGLRPLCTVVKPAIYRAWWIRPLLRASHHVEGSGLDPISTGRVIEDAVARLRGGLSVLIFPEGTRSPAGGAPGPFGRTPFEIACLANVPVIAVHVRCDPPYLSKDAPMFSPPHPWPQMSLTVQPPRDPADYQFNSRALRDAVEASYRPESTSDAGSCRGQAQAPHRRDPHARGRHPR